VPVTIAGTWPRRLVRWGPSGFAFAYETTVLYIVSGLDVALPDLVVAETSPPDPLTVGFGTAVRFSIRNSGARGSDVRVTVRPQPGLVLTAADAPGGRCTGTAPATCVFDTLESGASASVTVMIRPTQTGDVGYEVTATAREGNRQPAHNHLVRTRPAYTAPRLTITKQGTGRGRVTSKIGTSTTGPIDCGATCSALVPRMSSIRLEAQPEGAAQFVGWSGDLQCRTLSMVMFQDATCVATFTLPFDLAATAVTAPATGGAGRPITVGATVRNLSPAPATAPASRVAFYLSSSATLDLGTARPLGERTFDGLAGGAAITLTTSVTVPADIVAGGWFIAAVVDPDRQLLDGDFTNNTIVRAIDISQPDVAVTTIVAPAVVAAGGSATIQSSVKNLAAAASTPAFNVALFLSPGSTWDPDRARRLGAYRVSSLAGGAADTRATTVTVPADVTAGVYVVAARADDERAVPESNTTNNVAVSTPLTVQTPDLVAVGVKNPVTGATNRPLTVSVAVRNAAPAPLAAAAFTVATYVSPTASFDRAIARRIGSLAASGLPAGKSATYAVTGVIPGDLEPGDYYVAAVADDAGVLAETDKSNNVVVATSTIRIIRPQLRALAIAGPAVAGAGTSIRVTTTVRNEAPSPAAAPRFDVAVFLITSATFDPTTARRVGTLTTNGLAATSTAAIAGSVSVPADLSAGTLYLAARVDEASVIAESNEEDNVVVATTGLEIRVPDLTIASATAAALGNAGQSLTMSAVARNLAAAPAAAGPFAVDFELVVPDPSECAATGCPSLPPGTRVFLGRRAVAGVGAGGSVTATLTALVPANVPGGTFLVSATADTAGRLAEGNEDNNSRLGSRVVILPELRGSVGATTTSAEASACSDPADNGALETRSIDFYVTSETRDRVTGFWRFNVDSARLMFVLDFSAKTNVRGELNGTFTVSVLPWDSNFFTTIGRGTISGASPTVGGQAVFTGRIGADDVTCQVRFVVDRAP
ncbi:MAG TPA: CARDB domain-containing protein, partial [Solirubrobacteraceae bacterium]